jgi:hypothetical protein
LADNDKTPNTKSRLLGAWCSARLHAASNSRLAPTLNSADALHQAFFG